MANFLGLPTALPTTDKTFKCPRLRGQSLNPSPPPSSLLPPFSLPPPFLPFSLPPFSLPPFLLSPEPHPRPYPIFFHKVPLRQLSQDASEDKPYLWVLSVSAGSTEPSKQCEQPVAYYISLCAET